MKHQKPSTIEALNESIDLLVQENFEFKQKVETLEKEIKELLAELQREYHRNWLLNRKESVL